VLGTAKPKLQEQLRTMGKSTLVGLAEMVRAGAVTREQFEQEMASYVRRGLVDPEELAEVAATFEQA
jgi:hypothetical protein